MTTPDHTPQQSPRPTNGARDPRRSAAARPIMIATAVLGGLALVGTGATAAFSAVGEARAASLGTSTLTADTAGVTGVDLEIGGADVTLAFGDVDEATIEADGRDSDRWKLQRDGDRLVVESPRAFFDFCLGWCDEARSAVVTLPSDLEGVDLGISLGAGHVDADGEFGDLGVEVGAGEVVLAGAARSLDIEVSAGDFDAELSGVRTAGFDVSAGDIDARLTGSAPDVVEIDVSAGSLALELPDTPYSVDSDIAAGDLTNELSTDPSSKHRITARVAAGDIVLRPGEKPAR